MSELRPQSFDEFCGQSQTKAVLETAARAAMQRGDALEHVLLSGPPGLGKTSLAQILARSMGASLKITSGPTLAKGNIIPLLRSLQPRDALFIDEVHGLDSGVDEMLYPVMEDGRLDLCFGTRVRSLQLPRFTIIGATTRPDRLSAPLRQRFGIEQRLDYYAAWELAAIVKRSAGLLGIGIDIAAADEIARRSRGTPRIANSFLRRARDVAQLRRTAVTVSVAQAALDSLGVDSQGLNQTDRNLLSTIVRAGGCAGLNTLAAALGESEQSVEDGEAFLIRGGFIVRSPRGRTVTPLAHQVLGA